MPITRSTTASPAINPVFLTRSAASPASQIGALATVPPRWSRHGSGQRQKDQNDPERRHVPYKGAQQKNPCCVQGKIGDATPKIELNTQFGHPTVCGCSMRCQDGRGEQRKRLDKILQRPPQSARYSGQRRHSLIARTRRPDIAALQACSVRGEYDLYQSKDDAEGEHLEFKCHCYPDADCERPQ